MRAVRWRVMIPASVLLTTLVPALRSLPGGAYFPDPWLLLLLWAVPVPGPWSWKRPAAFVFLLGALRASVSTASPLRCWAGLALGLAFRHLLHRRLSENHFLTRIVMGIASALPLAAFDLKTAQELALFDAWEPLCVQVVALGVLWAFAKRPVPMRAELAGVEA